MQTLTEVKEKSKGIITEIKKYLDDIGYDGTAPLSCKHKKEEDDLYIKIGVFVICLHMAVDGIDSTLQ